MKIKCEKQNFKTIVKKNIYRRIFDMKVEKDFLGQTQKV